MGLNDRIVGGQVGGGDGKLTGAAAPLVPGLPRDRVDAEFDRQNELKGAIHSWVIQELGPRLFNQSLPETELRRLVRAKIEQALLSDHTPLARGERQDMVDELVAEVLGYGPIEEFLRDPTITRGHGQRVPRHLHRARRQALQDREALSRRRGTSTASSRRSWARWAGASTSRPPTWTPAFPTAPA